MLAKYSGALPATRVAPVRLPFELGVFWAAVLVQVLPLWVFPFVPSQDGPAHLENAAALLRYGHDPLFREFYYWNDWLLPNLFGHLVAAGLLKIVPALVTEKLILTGYLVLLPVAFRRVLSPAARGNGMALAIFPFVQAFHYQMGFWNFCWSVALFFLLVGMWQRSNKATVGGGASFAALSVLLYFMHPLTLTLVFLSIAGLLTWRVGAVMVRARKQPARLRRALFATFSRLLRWSPFLAPAAWLLFRFMHHQGASDTALRLTNSQLITRLVVLRGLVGLDARQSGGIAAEQALAILVSIVVLAACAWALATRKPRLQSRDDGWFALAMLFAVLYFKIPEGSAGGFHVGDRLMVFVFMALLVWLSQRLLARAMFALGLALGALSIAMIAIRLPRFAELQSYMTEFVSVTDSVSEGTVLLPLIWLPPGVAGGYKRVGPFKHATGYIAAARHLIDLANYEGRTAHFPLLFRPSLNPYRYMLGIEGDPPCVDLAPGTYPRQIDYVLTWSEDFRGACGQRMSRQLRDRYQLIFESTPRKLARLYKLKAF